MAYLSIAKYYPRSYPRSYPLRIRTQIVLNLWPFMTIYDNLWQFLATLDRFKGHKEFKKYFRIDFECVKAAIKGKKMKKKVSIDFNCDPIATQQRSNYDPNATQMRSNCDPTAPNKWSMVQTKNTAVFLNIFEYFLDTMQLYKENSAVLIRIAFVLGNLTTHYEGARKELCCAEDCFVKVIGLAQFYLEKDIQGVR